MKDVKGNLIGSWAFLIGVVLAVVLGAIGSITDTITIVLVVLGVLVGLLNVKGHETQPFLIAAAILVIVSGLGSNVLSSITWLNNILNAMLILFVPATVIVALKSVFDIARN